MPRQIVDHTAEGEAKRQRERERRKRFTPAQREAELLRQKLYVAYRRRTDESYLAKVREITRSQYSKHREKRIEAMRVKLRKTRLRCLQAYSALVPFCACCGETLVEFLTLDHLIDKRSDGGVRVGGNRGGQSLYSWLIRMQFPAGFRVLCYNCNCAKGTLGYCPHEVRLDDAIERMVI